MPIGKLIIWYLITTVAFFAIDFVWLSTATSRIYKPYLGDLLAEKPNLPVAALFYLFYVVGVLVLASYPALQQGDVWGAVWRAAIFGALAYGTYDLTNLATIRGWAWQVSVIDIIWGTTITSVTAVIGFYVGRWLGIGS
jgi:uncharacterized membrane protein